LEETYFRPGRASSVIFRLGTGKAPCLLYQCTQVDTMLHCTASPSRRPVLFYLVYGAGGPASHFQLSSQRKATSPFSPLSSQAGKKSVRVVFLCFTVSRDRRRGRGYIGIIIGIRPVSQLYLCITPLELLGSNIYLIILEMLEDRRGILSQNLFL